MVEETIRSVLNQSFTDFEYWVIDGGSTDGTQDIVKKYPDKIKLISEKDYGIYDAMNKGIANSKGDWLYFLNAGDTLYNKEVLKNIFATPIDTAIELIYGNIKTKNHPSGSDYTIGQEITLKDFYYRVGLCHQAAFSHRKAFNEIGNYNYFDYPVLADQEWFVRFFKERRESKYENLIIANYETVGESYLRRMQSHREHLKMVSSHFSHWVNFRNWMRSPYVMLKIKLIQNYSGSAIYKLYRRIFFKD
jgi:glycosyltransferase involved in cell wall biosynthesis